MHRGHLFILLLLPFTFSCKKENDKPAIQGRTSKSEWSFDGRTFKAQDRAGLNQFNQPCRLRFHTVKPSFNERLEFRYIARRFPPSGYYKIVGQNPKQTDEIFIDLETDTYVDHGFGDNYYSLNTGKTIQIIDSNDYQFIIGSDIDIKKGDDTIKLSFDVVHKIR